MTRSLLTLLICISLTHSALPGGDQRFSSGEVSYNGQFPNIGTVKKAHEFPMDAPGPLSPFIPESLLQHSDKQPLMQIERAKGVSILASSGHYGLNFDEYPAILSISETPNVEFAMLSREVQKKEIKNGLWIMNGEDRINDDHPGILWYSR